MVRLCILANKHQFRWGRSGRYGCCWIYLGFSPWWKTMEMRRRQMRQNLLVLGHMGSIFTYTIMKHTKKVSLWSLELGYVLQILCCIWYNVSSSVRDQWKPESNESLVLVVHHGYLQPWVSRSCLLMGSGTEYLWTDADALLDLQKLFDCLESETLSVHAGHLYWMKHLI